jgi:cysteine-rich repeat protein
VAASCGNGVVEGGEACDDGNAVGGDGCTGCVVDVGDECGGVPSVCAPASSFVRFPGEQSSLATAMTTAAGGVVLVQAGTHAVPFTAAPTSVTLVGEPGAALVMAGLFKIDAPVTVQLRSLAMSSSSSSTDILQVGGGGTLDVEACVIGPSNSTGIIVPATGASGTLRLRRSRIVGNTGGGVRVFGGSYTLENNFVSGNGTSNSQGGGVVLSIPGTFVHNTVAGNLAANARASGVACSAAVTLAFSVVTGNSSSRQIDTSCALQGSLVGSDVLLVDVANGDLHLRAGSPAIDAAAGSTATIDIDGQLRSGARDVGADER